MPKKLKIGPSKRERDKLESARRAATKVAKSAGDSWFSKLSKEAQAAYIKSHPNSKFAKGGAKKSNAIAKKAAETRKANRAQDRKLDTEIHKLNDRLRDATDTLKAVKENASERLKSSSVKRPSSEKTFKRIIAQQKQKITSIKKEIASLKVTKKSKPATTKTASKPSTKRGQDKWLRLQANKK